MKDWIDLSSAEIAKTALEQYRSTPTSGSALRLIEALASRVLQLEAKLDEHLKRGRHAGELK